MTTKVSDEDLYGCPRQFTFAILSLFRQASNSDYYLFGQLAGFLNRGWLLTCLATFFLATSIPAACFAKPSKPSSGPAQVLSSQKDSSEQVNKYILPRVAIPLEYDLSVEPDFSKFTFKGTESIKLQVLQETSEIVLNALELKIFSAQLKAAGAASKSPAQDLEIKLEPETEKVHFFAKSRILPGTYELSCKFEGVLNHQLRGLYRSSFEDEQHKKHWIAATQMEPTDARRMFPGFDEPAYKAVFRIKAIINKNYTAISNAQVEREESSGIDRKAVVFAATPKMSTYLLALVLGEFKSAGLTYSGPVPVRVWAVAGKEGLGKFAQSQAAQILDFETRYFGIPYFGKKLDLIALPELGMFSAMENAGAITFHDTAILADNKSSSSSQRLGIVSVMAHEMAHQWFGDLVTMKWWDDLWLNESFATWMTPKVLAALYPDSEASIESLYSRYGSMSTDSLKATRAIHAAVVNPSQAVEMFDGITYQKGAAVLQMLEAYVGADIFQRGIHKYLKEHALANASAEDFWNAIAAEAKAVPVAQIMRSFVFQPGYPQLNVKAAPSGHGIVISQYRQLRSGQDKSDPSLWMVPVVMRVLPPASGGKAPASTETVSRLLSTREQNFELKTGGLPVFVNAGGKGYYETCYERNDLKAFQAAFERLSQEEKIVLLNDCKTLASSGALPVEDYYNFVHMLSKESDPFIQTELVYILSAPDNYVSGSRRKDYELFLCRTLAPFKNKLDGWKQKFSDSQATKELRQAVLSQLGTCGQDKATVAEAFSMFQNYLKDRSSVNPEFVSLMLRIVTYNGSTKDYDELLKLYKSSSNPADKELVLHFLPSFHSPELARRTLSMGMGDDVKVKQGIGMIYGVAFNHYTREIAWTFIKEHWDQIIHRFPPESLRGLAGVGGTFDTPEKEMEVKTWYATHPVPYAKARVLRMLESLHSQVLYRQRFEKRICNWVAAEASGSSQENGRRRILP